MFLSNRALVLNTLLIGDLVKAYSGSRTCGVFLYVSDGIFTVGII